MSDASAPAADAAATAPSKPRDTAPLFALVNLLFALGGIGMLVYTKLIFKRPSITNSKELERIKKEHAKKQKALESALHQPGFVNFDQVTINLKPTHAFTTPGDPVGKVEGKLHYAQIGFAMELHDGALVPSVEAVKPVLYDKLLSLMGRKSYSELVTVQGRFLLKTQILDLVNQTLMEESEQKKANKKLKSGSEHASETNDEEEDEILDSAKEVMVTGIFFTHFMVQ